VEPASSSVSQSQEQQSPGYGDTGDNDWDDDWDDDDSQASNNTEFYQQQQSQTGSASGIGAPAPKPPVKKSYNRFSMFVKSGGEDYILGTKNKIVPSDCQVTVVEQSPGVYSWSPNDHPYGCSLASPKKESKLKGLKSYIAYQLTPSFNSIQVSRRYKHFDWLHERLVEKFISIPVPPLPDKQVTGRYQEDFIRHRLAQV
jgi:sorting nexin-9/18/33